MDSQWSLGWRLSNGWFTVFLFLLLSITACSENLPSQNIQQGLRIQSLSHDQISVAWNETKPASIENYELILNGNLIAETENTEFTITQLQSSHDYVLQIQSLDTNLQTVTQQKIKFKTSVAPVALISLAVDSQAPTTPANLRATSIGGSHVTLFWTPSIDDVSLSNYEIFDGNTLLASADTTQIQLTSLIPETVYQFQVRAVDTAGNASAFSNAITISTRSALTIAITHGPEIYMADCADCHGIDGAGVGTTIGVTRAMSLAELTTIIEQTMPPLDPTTCIADCAANVAQYILDTFVTEPVIESNPLAGFAGGTAQIQEVCARAIAANRNDAVTDAFCGATLPNITSITDLQAALGLSFNNPTATGRRNNGANGNPSFALTGHSSSLVAKEVNAINPRAIVFTANNTGGRRGGGPNAPPGFVALGFVRGDLLAEIVAADRVTNELNFYLFNFTLPCSATDSCTTGDLLTPATESGWTSFTLFDEVNLANTTLDCLHCHQTAGPGTAKFLILQELRFPWSHWFRSNTASNVLIDDFRAARGSTEAYAGIPANLITASDPRLLENLVRGNNNGNAFVQFNSRAIQAEVFASSPTQPTNNSVPGRSATWDALNALTISGNNIAVPYHDIKVTDPTTLGSLINAYQNFRSGVLTASALPDLRDAFYTRQLADIGFAVQAGLDAPGILSQACGQCHNSSLNQNLSRARFNIDLSAMSDTQGGVLSGLDRDNEIGRTISRLLLGANDIRVMPPKLFRKLNASEIDLVITYLCSQTASVISQCAGR